MNWRDVWSRREISQGNSDNNLEVALRLNGYDAATSSGVTEESFRSFVNSWGQGVKISPAESVYEFGCGSGAFLEVIRQQFPVQVVAGSDISQNLISAGKQLFSDLNLEKIEASEVDPEPRFDHCLSFGVFFYFPDHQYALQVLEVMKRKAVKSISIFDVPDMQVKQACETFRSSLYPPGEYSKRYESLPHLYFSREWFLRHLPVDEWQVHIEPQTLSGYAMRDFRFNLIAIRRA